MYRSTRSPASLHSTPADRDTTMDSENTRSTITNGRSKNGEGQNDCTISGPGRFCATWLCTALSGLCVHVQSPRHAVALVAAQHNSMMCRAASCMPGSGVGNCRAVRFGSFFRGVLKSGGWDLNVAILDRISVGHRLQCSVASLLIFRLSAPYYLTTLSAYCVQQYVPATAPSNVSSPWESASADKHW